LGRSNAESFKAQDDRLSVLDAISIGNSGKLVSGGWVENVLENVQKKGSLARESCASFDYLISSNFDFNPFGGGKYSDEVQPVWVFDRLAKAYSEYQETGAINGCRNESAASEIIRLARLSTDVAQVASALERPTLEAFLAEAIIPKSCMKTDRLGIPPFKIRNKGEAKAPLMSEAEISTQLQTLLQSDKPVVVSYCPNGRADESTACSGPGHVITIKGIRKLSCDGQAPFTVFEAEDSASGDGPRIINVHELASRMIMRQRQLKNSMPAGPAIQFGSLMTWLE
jgi:hypothetical protein